jgi:hypothetical protein
LNAHRLSPAASAAVEPPALENTAGNGAKHGSPTGDKENADELPEPPPPRQTSTALDAPGMTHYPGAGYPGLGYPGLGYPGAGWIGPAIPQVDSPPRAALGGVAGGRATGNTGFMGNLSGAAIGPVTLIGQAIPSIIPQASQRANEEATTAQGEPAQNDAFRDTRYPIQRWTAPSANPLVSGAQAGALTRNSRGGSNARGDANSRGDDNSANRTSATAGARGALGPTSPCGNPWLGNPVARILRGPPLYGPSIATGHGVGFGSGMAADARMTSAATTPNLGGGLSTASAPLARPLESAATAPTAPRQGAFSTESQPLPAAPQSAATVDLLPGQQPLSLPR